MTKKIRWTLGQLQKLDTNMCLMLNRSSEYDLIKLFFVAISRLGDGLVWYCLMISLILMGGNNGLEAVSHMIISGGIGTLIYKWLKHKISRPRPYQVSQKIQLQGKILDQFSFPSGHTLHAVIFTLICSSYYPALFPYLLILTLLISLSRVILGLHYPSDVLMGAIIGIEIAWASEILYPLLKSNI
ncbi:MAG: phosphatase PAP2 family protein [Methylophilales bacterium]|jgi:undecaprenyl-diphosphatase|nr:phosphatase PAP2 family protein [Pseudomonadota bacterium]NQW35350.1 phosphatase PAP2 family protein [Methylophilales bacterium]